MVVLMVVAATYAVLQLALVTSGSRTVRVSTLLLAIAAGAYGCGVLALVGELAYTRGWQALTGQPLAAVVKAAGYSVDPVIEEVAKALPLVGVLVAVRRLRAQWGVVDHLLVGAALGSGFGLAEALMRTAGQAAYARPDRHGGYIVATGLDAPRILGLPTLLTRWLPAPVDTWDLFGITGGGLHYHLAWSALAGFGIGLLVRGGGRRRLLGLVPIAYAAVDHVAMNYALRHLSADGWSGSVLDTMNAVRRLLPGVVLVLVGAGTAIDVRATRHVRSSHPALLLAGERTGSLGAIALARAALVAPPLTVLVVLRFLLLRRAAWNELAAAPRAASELAVVVSHLAGQLDRADDRGRWRRAAALRRGRLSGGRWVLVVVWLVLLLPALAYLVVGAAPATADLQRAMASPAGLLVLQIAGVGASGYLAVQLILTVRQLRTGLRQPSGQEATRAMFRLMIAGGGLVAGVVLLVGSHTPAAYRRRVLDTFHILDALGTIALVAALALFLAALIYFPPVAFVALAEGGAIIVVTQAAATSAGMIAGAAALGSLGVLLNEASESGAGAAPTPKSGRRKGVHLEPATKAKVQEKLPPEWGDGLPNRRGIGSRWQEPGRGQNGVRADKGDPDLHPSQQVDHVIVNYEGNIIGPDGKPIVGRLTDNPKAHVPLIDWLKWSTWWRP